MSDFFDDEYKKQEPVQQNNSRGNTQGYAPPPPPINTMSKTTAIILIVVMVMLIFGSFAIGILYGKEAKNSPTAILDAIIDEMKQNSIYYDAENWEAIVDAMVLNAGTSLLQTVDTYGYLLSPKQLFEIINPSESGEDMATYGISFLNTTVGYYVRQISYGSGAFKSDLMVGDIVMRIERENYSTVDVRTATESEINEILSGGWGTTATFTALRGIDTAVMGDDISVVTATVAKEKYQGNFVDYYFESGVTDMDTQTISKLALSGLDFTGIGYIKLNSFEETGRYVDGEYIVSDNSALQIADAMEKFKQEYSSSGKLILDLRGNPGGSVDIAKSIASYFIYDVNNTGAKDLLVTTLEYRGNSKTAYRIESKFSNYFDVTAARFNKQIVVLTDNNSASASELLLGCMLDYGTCLQVGEKTYGKGIAQTAMPLTDFQERIIIKNSDGSTTRIKYCYGMYYTIARYFTPISEKNIHGKGFIPTESNTVNTNDNTALLARAKTLLS